MSFSAATPKIYGWSLPENCRPATAPFDQLSSEEKARVSLYPPPPLTPDVCAYLNADSEMRQLRERIRTVKLRQDSIRPLLAKFAKATGRNEKDIVGAVASFTTSVVGGAVSGRESRARLAKRFVGTKDKDTKGRGEQQQQQQQQSAGRTVSMTRGPGRAKGKVSRRKFHERLVRCGRMGKLGGWKGRHVGYV
jgi:hypothetical protein